MTVADGYDYFVIVGNDTEVLQGAINTPGTFSSSTSASAFGTSNSAFGQSNTTGTFNPGQSIPYAKHKAEAMIKMFKGQKPSNEPGAFDAHELIRYLGTPSEGTN